MWNGGVVDTQQVLELMKTVAAEVITPRFRSLADGEVMEKNPGDLVTIADQESEAILTRELSGAFPGAFVLGEEVTSVDPTTLDRYVTAEHAFTVDPVDGTKNFVHGSPDHAVMVSEVVRGETVRAWIWQPEHEVAWVAEKGAGVYRNGERVVREPVADGIPPRGVTSIWPLRGHSLGSMPALVGSWVCCGVDYPRLMEGATDYILYARNSPWDHSPGTLMVTEAGGFAGHTDGTPYSPTVLTPGIIVAADRGTYAAVRRHASDAFAKRS
ncbi:inositol monophosphatase family protein [Pedococcus bigeumensis]